MITRWFPPKERPFAIGLVTGGRQIGTLLILPLSGVLCKHKELMGGWPSIFYFSAMVGSCILVAWLLMAADKPSKQTCIRDCERRYIGNLIGCRPLPSSDFREENRRRESGEAKASKIDTLETAPSQRSSVCRGCSTCVPRVSFGDHVTTVAHVPQTNPQLGSGSKRHHLCSSYRCSIFVQDTEFVLVILYWISKTRYICHRQNSFGQDLQCHRFLGSCRMHNNCSLLQQTRSTCLFNHGIVFVRCVCRLRHKNFSINSVILGLHTPGVQTALLQLAPAYTGIVTGIAFGVVAVFGIINKVFSTYIASDGTLNEWRIVFGECYSDVLNTHLTSGTSAVIALLPVFFFSVWGSADRQPWATIHSSQTMSTATIEEISKIIRVSSLDLVISANDKKIAAIASSIPASTSQSEEGVPESDVEEEQITSALRLRMFLSRDSTEEDDITSTGETDIENANHNHGGYRF